MKQKPVKIGTLENDSNIEISLPLAIGTLQWGTTPIDQSLINSPRGCISESEAFDITHDFAKAGVTLFDTAEGYGGGTSEKRLGRIASRLRKTENTRENNDANRRPVELLLMTKFLPVLWRYSHSCFERALRSSNDRMGVDCCPIYLIHSPVHWRPIDYWVESAAICRKKGLLKALGLSNCNADQVRKAVVAGRKYGVPVVCNQVHYSLLDYNSAALHEMENACRELGVTIIAYTPLGQGLLTDKLTHDTFHTNKPAKMFRMSWGDLQPLRSCLRQIANSHNATMAQVALNWCAAHGTVVLVGCRSVRQAKDTLGAVGWDLKEEEVQQLDKLALGRCTLDSPHWRRALFVTLAGVVMVIARTLDWFGMGMVKQAL